MSQSDPELEQLESLARLADHVQDALSEYLAEYPSSLLTHHVGRLGDVSNACRRQAERVAGERARAREREERHAQHAEERKYDAHTKAMAEQMGLTPDEFLELQAERRKGMRGPAGTVTYSPDHEVIR